MANRELLSGLVPVAVRGIAYLVKGYVHDETVANLHASEWIPVPFSPIWNRHPLVDFDLSHADVNMTMMGSWSNVYEKI